MEKITIIGAGPSGVHFAQTLLAKGYPVVMIDGGYTPDPQPLPGEDFHGLKKKLTNPSGYFLGEDFSGVLLPGDTKEYYGIPPGKNYIFRRPKNFSFSSQGFEPLYSFAAGGLAETWTGGCYPFNDHELAEFPFGFRDLEPFYALVAKRIGITGERDDLSQFLPWHEGLMESMPLDLHSLMLLEKYRWKYALKSQNIFLGRTRVAVQTEPHDQRKECTQLGRCLWGCPRRSLYVPSHTLEQCLAHPLFEYHAGWKVSALICNQDRKITAVEAQQTESDVIKTFPVDRVVLAAGALETSTIFLRSIAKLGNTVPKLSGLMDNRQVLMPFVNRSMIGKPFDPQSYQYHLLGLGIPDPKPAFYIHGQITTLKTALMHPILQKLPLDFRTASMLGKFVHAALGVLNLNFHDYRRETNYLSLVKTDSEAFQASVNYEPPEDEQQRIDQTLKKVRCFMASLGCFVPPGMTHVRPMGASVHYAGTLPMSASNKPFTITPEGRSRYFPNVYIADGAGFPFLPAKNLTFTLMANAVRIASNHTEFPGYS